MKKQKHKFLTKLSFHGIVLNILTYWQHVILFGFQSGTLTGPTPEAGVDNLEIEEVYLHPSRGPGQQVFARDV